MPPGLLITEICPLYAHEPHFNGHVDNIDQVNSRCRTAKWLCGTGNESLKGEGEDSGEDGEGRRVTNTEGYISLGFTLKTRPGNPLHKHRGDATDPPPPDPPCFPDRSMSLLIALSCTATRFRLSLKDGFMHADAARWGRSPRAHFFADLRR